MNKLEELRTRIAALSQEIRDYPTPIARCDEQLTQLLEERAKLMAQLEAQESKHGGMNAA